MKKVSLIKRISMLLLGVFLASCNNFLDGGNFKEQLEKDIAYAKAKECTLVVRADSKYGTFLSEG